MPVQYIKHTNMAVYIQAALIVYLHVLKAIVWVHVYNKCFKKCNLSLLPVNFKMLITVGLGGTK